MCHFLQSQRQPVVRIGFTIMFALTLATACPAKEPVADRLIVPGERIGSTKLNARGIDDGEDAGKTVFDDASLGSADTAWYVGAGSRDGGKPFRRPYDVSWHGHRDEEGHHYITSRIAVTSPLYGTADGIRPTSTLAEIQAKFPDLIHDPEIDKTWPGIGEVEFFSDGKHGITFAILKGSAVCIEIGVYPPTNGSETGGLAARPAASFDFDINSFTGSIGQDLKLGLSDKALIKLLGRPVGKTYLGSSGTMWRWRLPFQKTDEAPALAVNFAKLPDGSFIANCLRVSSPFFHLQPKIFPGCHLEDVKRANAFTAWLNGFESKEGHFDLYGDFHSGEVFEVRANDGVCMAISIVPPLLETATQVNRYAH